MTRICRNKMFPSNRPYPKKTFTFSMFTQIAHWREGDNHKGIEATGHSQGELPHFAIFFCSYTASYLPVFCAPSPWEVTDAGTPRSVARKT
jgi:hypothetical protein